MGNIEISPYSTVGLLEKPKPPPIEKLCLDNLYKQVPSPEKRRGISTERIKTAGHEFNHAIVALALGVPILSLSVIPDGDSQGRTTFAGHIPAKTMQLIAAAGKVATCDGHAHGYGSDMSKVALLSRYFNGMSEEEASTQAENIIHNYCSSDVRKRVEQMIACVGEIPGHKIPLFLTTAQIEVNLKKGINYEIPNEQKTENNSENEHQTDKKTVIKYLTNGDQRIIYLIGNKTEREELMCHLCLGVNDHDESCPRHKKEVIIFP